MELLGLVRIDLPGEGLNRQVTFGFSFGQMEITAYTKNKLNGQNFETKFELSKDP